MKVICYLLLILPILACANVEYFKRDDANKVSHVKIIFAATINTYSAKDLILTLDEINASFPKVKEIALYINSPGGNFYATLMAVDAIKSSKIPVRAVNYGMVASGASLLYCAASIRESLPSGFFILHPAATELSGDYRPDTLHNENDIMDHVATTLKSSYRACTHLDNETIDKIIHSEGTRAQLTAEEAVKDGLAARLITQVAYADNTYFITDDK